jgi:hypothetical protein
VCIDIRDTVAAMELQWDLELASFLDLADGKPESVATDTTTSATDSLSLREPEGALLDDGIPNLVHDQGSQWDYEESCSDVTTVIPDCPTTTLTTGMDKLPFDRGPSLLRSDDARGYFKLHVQDIASSSAHSIHYPNLLMDTSTTDPWLGGQCMGSNLASTPCLSESSGQCATFWASSDTDASVLPFDRGPDHVDLSCSGSLQVLPFDRGPLLDWPFSSFMRLLYEGISLLILDIISLCFQIDLLGQTDVGPFMRLCPLRVDGE